jgi:hypothetical protein
LHPPLPLNAIRKATVSLKFLALALIPLVKITEKIRVEFLAFLLIPLVAVHEEIRVKFFALVYIWQQVTFINLSMVMSLEYLLERFATGSCVGYAIARTTMDASVLKTRENFMFELRGGTSTSLMHYIGISTYFIPFCRFVQISVRDYSKWTVILISHQSH